MSWAITDAVRDSEEDMIRAQEEAWNRVRYRSEWFLGRTLGHCVISSLAAVYVFWHEAPSGPSVQLLALLWVAVLTIGLTIFDYRTRPVRQGWPDVLKHIPRHIALAALCLLIAIAAANAIHGLSTLLSKPAEPPKQQVAFIEPRAPASRPLEFAPPEEAMPEEVKPLVPAKIQPSSSAAGASAAERLRPSPPPKTEPALSPKPKPNSNPSPKPKPVTKVSRPSPPARLKTVRAKTRKAHAARPRASSSKKGRADRPWAPLVKVERRTPKHYRLNASGF